MHRKFRVCIITPVALGSNPRVVKEAGALQENGHDVTVISTRTLALVDRRDDTVLANAAWSSYRLDFRSRGNAWRLRRAVQTGYELGFSIAGYGSIADRALSPFTRPLAAAARRLPADLYIAHYPAALPAAAIAARRHGALYAFDAEDFHLGDLPDEPQYEPQRRLIRTIETRYLSRCAYITAASPGIADAYADAYEIARPTVVLNVFPRAQAPWNPMPAGTAEPGPSLYWFSQTIGPDRGIECAVRAIGRARARPHLHLRGTPASGFLGRLQTIGLEAGVADRLHILTPAAPSEMERLAASNDVGFSGEPGHTGNNRVALGNKLFTYLLAGLPVVLSDIPAHRAFAPQLGNAARLYITEDAESLAAALDFLLEDRIFLATARVAAFRLGQTRFNWDIEKAKLLEIVATVLASRTGGVQHPTGEMRDYAGSPRLIRAIHDRVSGFRASHGSPSEPFIGTQKSLFPRHISVGRPFYDPSP
jgi:glycosyltransferase involved in cell wall biosynthesis